MKITLISTIFSDVGVSTIAPLLKREGHQVRLLFIPELITAFSNMINKKTINQINEFVKNDDLIGINCMSENHFKVTLLADEIKRNITSPLVWGGIYATLQPEDCLKHTDIVCVGEGEDAMLELADKLEKGKALESIKNLIFKNNIGKEITYDLRNPIDLNQSLALDYDLETQYVVKNNRIQQVEESDFKGHFFSYTSRGCPHACSYCCNEAFNQLYSGNKIWRQRNLEHVIDDLKEVKKKFPSFKHTWFNEADFLSGKSIKALELFGESYKKEINVPFSIWSHPHAVKDKNIEILKAAGLVNINVGTINGSERIQKKIFKRKASSEFYIEKSKILLKYGINTEYDLILCNPYEEEEDIIKTIKLIMKLSKPFKIVIYSLSYFKKTVLYEDAVKDGIITEDYFTQSYTKALYKVWKFQNQNVLINIVAAMMRGTARKNKLFNINFYGILPEPLLKLFIKKKVRSTLKKIPFTNFIYAFIANLILATLLITRIVRGKVGFIVRIFRESNKKIGWNNVLNGKEKVN